jgi:hypothetical protein
MKSVMFVSTRLYRILTLAYPEEFRRRWEPEMADTFELLLTAAIREKRWTAVAGAWYTVATELLLIAAPLQLANLTLIVPLAAVAGAGAMFYGLVWALQNSLALRALYHHAITQLGG